MWTRREGLWRHPGFLKLWAGQTVSVFGTLIGKFALPLVAILALHATQAQVALLYACDALPTLALGLVAGAIADRLRRRPLMIAADLGRALALSAIPVAAALGALRLELLYVVAVIVSALSILFDAAYPAYLTTLVEPDQLIEGNAKLSASMSVAEIGGFGLAGSLAQALTAPLAVGIDAVTYIVSIASLALIREPEPSPGKQAGAGQRLLSDIASDIAQGLKLTWRQPLLRALSGAGALQAICASMLETALLIYILRDLHLSAAVTSLIFGVGGATSLAGAAIAERLTARYGLQRALRWSVWIQRASAFLIPLAGGPAWLAITLLVAQQCADAANTVFEITSATSVQMIAPRDALGRVAATALVLQSAGALIGLALGAATGQALGARGTLFLAAAGMLAGPLWISMSQPTNVATRGEAITASGECANIPISDDR